MIRFEVPGSPIGKARARFTRNGHAYTPARTQNFEAWVKMQAQLAMAGSLLLSGPLRLEIQVFMAIPNSWSAKKKRQALESAVYPVVRPDWDNIAKLIGDALNKLVYADDALIVDALVTKRYSDRPRLVVEVSEL